MKLAVERSLRDAKTSHRLHIETAQPRVLDQGVAECRDAVIRTERVDRPPIEAHLFPGLEALDVNGKGKPLHAEAHRRAQRRSGPGRAVDVHALFPALKSHRPEQPRQAEEVVGVAVRDEDAGKREAGAEPHDLTLGSLAAVPQDRLAFALDRDPRHIAADGWPRGGGAQKADSYHGEREPVREIRGQRRRRGRRVGKIYSLKQPTRGFGVEQGPACFPRRAMVTVRQTQASGTGVPILSTVTAEVPLSRFRTAQPEYAMRTKRANGTKGRRSPSRRHFLGSAAAALGASQFPAPSGGKSPGPSPWTARWST